MPDGGQAEQGVRQTWADEYQAGGNRPTRLGGGQPGDSGRARLESLTGQSSAVDAARVLDVCRLPILFPPGFLRAIVWPLANVG